MATYLRESETFNPFSTQSEILFRYLRVFQKVYGLNKTAIDLNKALAVVYTLSEVARDLTPEDIGAFARNTKIRTRKMIQEAKNMTPEQLIEGVQRLWLELVGKRVFGGDNPIYSQMTSFIIDPDKSRKFADDFLNCINFLPNVPAWKKDPPKNEEDQPEEKMKKFSQILISLQQNLRAQKMMPAMVTAEGVPLSTNDMVQEIVKKIDLSQLTGKSKVVSTILTAATTYLFFRLSFDNLIRTVDAVHAGSGFYGALGVEFLEAVLLYIASTDGLISYADSKQARLVKKSAVWAFTCLIFALDVAGILYAGYGGLREPILPNMPKLVSDATKITIAALGAIWPNMGFNITVDLLSELFNAKRERLRSSVDDDTKVNEINF